MQSITIQTKRGSGFIDITDEVEKAVVHSGINDGIIMVFVPHTTAAVTINENADPDVVHDLLLTLDELIPHIRTGYRHSEGNSDAHVKSSIIGSSVSVIVQQGRLSLGTWQGIYFCEFDGPRQRQVILQVCQK